MFYLSQQFFFATTNVAISKTSVFHPTSIFLNHIQVQKTHQLMPINIGILYLVAAL